MPNDPKDTDLFGKPLPATPPAAPASAKPDERYNQDGGLSLTAEEWLMYEEAYDDVIAKEETEEKAKEAQNKKPGATEG